MLLKHVEIQRVNLAYGDFMLNLNKYTRSVIQARLFFCFIFFGEIIQLERRLCRFVAKTILEYDPIRGQ